MAHIGSDDGDERGGGEKLTGFQRSALRRLRKAAGRGDDEPLCSEDWLVLWSLDHTLSNRAMHRLWRALPADPRCRMCGAPFGGIGRYATRPLGFRPSRKNPHFCATCVELSPPGGTKMPTGVLFADLRGFTTASEHADPEEMSKLLRRFYGCAERALFPEAIIDKLIGDEVMAIYLGPILPDRDVPALMIDHARELLRSVGYGSADGPFVEVGIGIDFGEAYVGNIGDRDVYDFTAIGDVVNTAARLQGHAAGGEILVAGRAMSLTGPDQGERVELELKGKDTPVTAQRIRVA